MSTFQIHIRENSFLRSDKQELLFLMLTLCYFMPFIFVKSLLVAFFFFNSRTDFFVQGKDGRNCRSKMAESVQ